MTKNNMGRRFPLSGSGEALFRLSFFPDEIGAGPGLFLSSAFFLTHALMPWTAVAIAMGVGLTGRGLPLPCLTQRPAHLTPHLARPPASSPAPRGGGSHGDTRWKAVPPGCNQSGTPGCDLNNVINSCFVGHYRKAVPEPPRTKDVGLTGITPEPERSAEIVTGKDASAPVP